MIDKELLDLLVCPEDGSPLSLADEKLLALLNGAIAAGKVKNRLGRVVGKSLEGGLVRADRSLLYPVVDGIPVLLIDEAIPLEQVPDACG